MPKSAAEELQETISVVKGVYSGQYGGPMSPLAPDVMKDFNTALGLIPYNLEPGARLLAPVITPIRNMIPRNKGYGKATEFKAVTSYNSNYTKGWVTEGVSNATPLATTTVDVLMPYKIASQINFVTFEARYFGVGQVDAKSLAVANLLRAFMIDEEDRILFGNPTTSLVGASAGGSGGTAPSSGVSIGGALGTAPTLIAGNYAVAATGGFINGVGVQYHFRITARTGPDYGLGKTSESAVSAADFLPAAAGGTTNVFTITPPFVQGAIGYVLYWKLSTDANYTRVPFSGRAVLTTYTVGQGTVPLTSLPTDSSSDPNAFPGIIQQLLAPGSGAFVFNKYATGNQTPASINANPFALNMGTSTVFSDIDNVYSALWQNGKADPDLLLVNATENLTINRSLASTPFFIQPNGSPNEAVGNYRVSRFTNGVTGTIVDLRIHPSLSQGCMLALSTKMPQWYPGSGIPSVWSMEMVYDYLELDYPPTQPRWPIEIRNSGALLCYLPLINAVFLNIGIA